MSIKQMIDKIRKVVSECDASEKTVYEALVCEAEGWKMRLEELEEDDSDA